MMISKNGQIVRIGVTGELREMGRNTQGVRLLRLDADDLLVSVARVVPEETTGVVDDASVETPTEPDAATGDE